MENEIKNTTGVSNENIDTTEFAGSKVDNSNENHCPNCQALLGEDQAFCPDCGTSLKKVCPKCGTEVIAGHTFCSKCGTKISYTQLNDSNSSINQFNNVVNKQNKKKTIPIIVACIGVAIVAIVLYFTKIGVGMNFNKDFANIADETWCEIASD